MIIKFVEILALIACGVPVAYLAFLSLLALFKRRCYIAEQTRFRRFAIVIPAHNEERSIAKTLCSAFAVDFPRRSFDVVVIADNCTDQTAAISRSFGARVLERNSETERGKGYALRWCFDILLKDPSLYEAVCVIDADSTLSANFLTVMNHYIQKGARIIQASDMVEPRQSSWTVEIIRLGFTLYNVTRSLGRSVIGSSVGLRGNGMCFRADVLIKYPWEATSLTEDLEYGLNLLLAGERVVFAQEAIVLATMPESPQNAESQRTRWEAGRFPIIRNYTPQLLWKSLTQVSFRHLEAWIDLVTPPFVNLVAVILGFGTLTTVCTLVGIDDLREYVILWGILLVLAMIHVLFGLFASHAKASLYKALMYVPRYIVWKFVLYLKLLRNGRTRQWVRTTREPQDMARP